MDTLLILKDTVPAKIIKVVDSCQPCTHEAATNCQDVIVVAIVCGAVVLTTLVIAVSLLIYFRIKNSKLRKLQEAERNQEIEEKWFSLRKEYQSVILSILKPKETPDQRKKSSEERETDTKESNDNSKEKNVENQVFHKISEEERFIGELRDCIKWIDEQKK